MNSIIFDKDRTYWKTAGFINRNGGMMNEFDDYFSIWTETGCKRFKNGDTISFVNGEFFINKQEDETGN